MFSSNGDDFHPEAEIKSDDQTQPESELESGPRAERPNFLTATRFSDFDLPPEIMEGVDKAGFEYCTPIQAQAIPVAMAGYDIAGQAQTGTGKTTAFLVPLLNRLLKNKPLEPGVPRAIIITPTRELALQIHEDALVLAEGTNLRQVLVIGGMDYKEQAELLKAAPEIVICTPGRIIDYLQQGVFKTKGIEAAVVDEADRLLDMGFIKDLKYLLGKLPPFTQRQTMLFSATLDERVMELTYQYMNPPQYITAEPDKSTKVSIEQELYHIGREEKLSLLIGLLRREEHHRVIIFANTKSGVEWLAKKLTMNGFQAEGITGDLPQPKRLKLMEAFKENRLQILVATDVASRGIHVDEVSHVYNYDLPQDAENYVHRIGRTARAGNTGKAVSFGCEDYVFHLEAIENLLGEKIPVFWAEQDWFQEDHGGEVKLRDRRGGERRKPEKRGGRDSGGGRAPSRGPAKSQRPGGIFGLAPRLTGEGQDDPRQVLSWKVAAEEPPVVEGEFTELPDADKQASEKDGRDGRRRKRRRGRRGREAAVDTAAVSPGEVTETSPAASSEAPREASAETEMTATTEEKPKKTAAGRSGRSSAPKKPRVSQPEAEAPASQGSALETSEVSGEESKPAKAPKKAAKSLAQAEKPLKDEAPEGTEAPKPRRAPAKKSPSRPAASKEPVSPAKPKEESRYPSRSVLKSSPVEKKEEKAEAAPKKAAARKTTAPKAAPEKETAGQEKPAPAAKTDKVKAEKKPAVKKTAEKKETAKTGETKKSPVKKAASKSAEKKAEDAQAEKPARAKKEPSSPAPKKAPAKKAAADSSAEAKKEKDGAKKSPAKKSGPTAKKAVGAKKTDTEKP